MATLKLVDTARSFYDATPELHQKDISRTDFKKVFLERFKESRTDQFLFSELHSAQQGQRRLLEILLIG